MHQLVDLFHKIYNVEGLVQIGGIALIAAIIFAETGLMVGFFLPGDSLLVTAGIYSTSANPNGAPLFNIVWLNLVVMAAAIIGDTVGYWIGVKAGPRSSRARGRCSSRGSTCCEPRSSTNATAARRSSSPASSPSSARSRPSSRASAR
jgi:hypothetical protein